MDVVCRFVPGFLNVFDNVPYSKMLFFALKGAILHNHEIFNRKPNVGMFYNCPYILTLQISTAFDSTLNEMSNSKLKHKEAIIKLIADVQTWIQPL